MDSLASMYRRLGRFEEATDFYRRVIPLRKQILGENHPDSLESIAGLAALSVV
jgi:hypothetical protein